MRKALLFLLGAVLFLMPNGCRAAASNAGLTISPVLQDITVDALGTGTDSSFTLTNSTAAEQVLHLSAVDFDTLSDQAGVVFLGLEGEGLSGTYRLASWMHLSTDRVVLSPGESEKVTVRIENNESLTPGGHYGAVLAETGDGDSGTDDGVSFRQALSSLFFIKKTGGERYDLSVIDSSSDASWYKLPQKVSIRFRNGGNVHVVPRGTVELHAPGGALVSRQIINGDSAILLPEHIRTLQATLPGASWWRSPGLYTIDVAYRFDGQDAFAKVSVSAFYMGSPAYIVCILVFLALLILSVKRLIRVKRSRHPRS